MPKGDKRKKKEVAVEIVQLEAKLDEKHKQEINEYSKHSKSEKVNET